MISLAVLKADIMYRLQILAFGVQDDDQHRMFKPGEMWWVSSLGDDWRQKYPEAKHICELLGISISDMSKAFGKRWTGNLSAPFHLFRHRKLGNVNFTTVQMINEFSDYGSGSLAPHYDETKGNYNSVASKQLHSTALRRLEKQICTSSDLKRSEFIEKANELTKPSPTATKKKPAPATAKTKKKPAPATAMTVTKSITTTMSPASPSAQEVIPPIASQDAPPADAIPIPTEDAPPEAIAQNGLVNDNQPEISLPEILTYVKNLRKDEEKCVQEDVRKQSSHIAYELVTILKDSDDRVFLRPERAGGSSWSKEVNSRGGNSERSIQRVSKGIREVQTKRVSKMSKAARQKTLTKVNQVVARYKRFKRDLIVLDRDDHLSLLSAGGMTDRQMLAFGRRFAKLTGVVFHNSGNTLAKSTANVVPDCTISKVKVAIKGQEVERQSLQVDRLTDVISHRIVSLYENKVLKKSSDMTLLDDDTLIIRFGGDKGGNFMQFKYGITVMNCHSPNGADAFDICMTLDAPDTYANLQPLFESKEAEHEFYFNLETPPSFAMLETEDNQVLCDCMFNVDRDSTTKSFEEIWANREEVELDMDDNESSAGCIRVDHTQSRAQANSKFSLKVARHGGFVSRTWTKSYFAFAQQFPLQNLTKSTRKHTSSTVYLEAISHSSIWWWACRVALLVTRVTFAKYYLPL
jgi:hypothetical protein